jgi:undecaprenyl-diphosphatase
MAMASVRMSSWMARLDAHDRRLYAAWACVAARHPLALRGWRAVTHAGGAPATIGAAVLPLLGSGGLQTGARGALPTLVLAHVLVQLVKRTVTRGRPSTTGATTLAPDPDHFSFPSGHSNAAMAVALAYGLAIPILLPPLLVLAMLVGLSRVVLGVHYPGDVLAGQVIAAVAAVTVHLLG